MGMNTASVQRLYVAYFNRPADPVGLAAYEAMLPTDREATQAELLVIAEKYFSPSTEYTGNFEGKSDFQIVDQLYQNIFGREADVEGGIDWATKLTNGTMTVAELALQLSYSAQLTDGDVVSARIEAATAFTSGLDTTAEINGYNGTAAAAEGRSYLAQISGELPVTTAEITAAKDAAIANVDESITSAVNAGDAVAGSSFTLTTGIDSLTGTAGNDSFSGTIGSAEPTITSGDSVTGAGGTDLFQITSTGTTGTVAGVSLSGVETIRVSDTSTGATTVNLAGQSGVATLESFGSAHTNTLSFTNVGAIADLSLSNTSGTAATTVTYTSSVTTGTNTQKIMLDNAAGTADTTVAGIEVFDITASSDSDLQLAASSATTVNVDSASDVKVDLDATGNTSLKTVSAAGSAGDMEFILDFSTVEMSATGGDGDDTFDVTAGNYGLNDSLDGGDGSDTVRLQGIADDTNGLGSVGSSGATFANIENLRLVAVNDGGAGAADYTVDLDSAPSVEAITAITQDTNLASAVTLNDLSATQAGAITIAASGAGATGITLALDLKDGTGTADSATVTASTVESATMTINDDGANGAIEQLTVNVVGDHDQTIAIEAGSFGGTTAGQGSLTITGGGADRTMTISNALSSDTINLSGVLSDTTLTAATGVNHTITGGSGDDDVTFTTGLTGSDTVDLGDGNDRVIITPATGISLTPTITNVEEFEILASASVTLNVGSVTVPELILTAAATSNTNVVTMANSTAVTDITVTAAAGADTANGLTFTGSGYSGTDDTVTITASTVADAMTMGAMTLGGIENINIVLTGDSTEDTFNIGNLVNNALNTMTVTSSGYGATTTGTDIVLGSVGDGANGMSSFDASGADTGVSVTLADMAASSSVTGSAFRDNFILTGSAGGAIVSMGAGNDQVTASAAGDTIYGEGGNDILAGAGGADTLDGGAGNDTITGNVGADTITTGTGIDTIVRNGDGTTDGDDTVTDFTAGAGGDVIDFTTSAAAGTGITASSLQSSVNLNGGGGGATVTSGGFVTVDDNATALTAAGIEAAITGGANDLTANAAADNVFYLAIDNGVSTVIALVTADTGAAIPAADIDIIITLTGLADATTITSANLADFI